MWIDPAEITHELHHGDVRGKQWQLMVGARGTKPPKIFVHNIAMKNDLFIELVRTYTTCQN